ncbi:Lipid-binding putative hydrolase [Pedobacter westerhofensis]|uniref:Lipid-binding putative hydrolase n=1 Tax=Pedobacter westerhofensis TaxID=425512 RepID=A0A521DW14_9SPHI|nr:lipid-binding protein [Pedobacter westerhofensis]SMO75291.1 Lipid-binding putative hydrolase [Pedobacter westerhofensis]
MKKYLYILTLCVLALSSCKKEEVGGTAVQSLANEWYVQVTQINATTGAIIDDSDDSYYTLSTYNTADNSPTVMWMDDSQSYYGLKTKVNVDLANKAFSVTNADELYFGVKVTITNGKVVTDGAVGPASKAVTDAISYDAQFSDTPGVIFRFKGYGRTRFTEDDH